MGSSLPKLRNDLRISRHVTAAGTSFVVKEPASGNFFRLGEAEYFIAQHFDGKTPLETVRQRVEEKFDASLSSETLRAFINELDKRHFFEDERGNKSKKPRRRISGNLLFLRFRAFDPTRLFDRLELRIRFFFTPHFVILSAVFILFSVGVTIAHWDEFVTDVSRLYRITAVPMFMMVVFVVVIAHECAHGLTCRYFKGEVHEIGFLLIYFQPAMYCNVSDAWLFPEKSKRMWVGAAGPYFELFLWALAVMAWRITESDTSINDAALIVVATSSVKTFLNLNPLLKWDGYYLLSDWLEVPNLRRRSFKYVGDLLRRLAGLPSRIADAIPRRERWIYMIYGVVATFGSFSILFYVLVTAGGRLVEGRQPTVVMLSMGLLFLKFRRRFRRLFGKRSDSADDLDDDFDDESSDAGFRADHVENSFRAETDKGEPSRSDPTPVKSSRRNKSRKLRPRAIWSIIGVVSVAVFLFGHSELRVSGPFNILPEENDDVRAPVEAVVDTIYVDEGDEVRKGDLIAQLSEVDLRAELRKTEADLAAKQARLNMLIVGTRPEEIELARKAVETSATKAQQALDLYNQAKRSREERLALAETTIKKGEERLLYGQKSLQMQEELIKEGLGSIHQVDEAAEQVAVRRRELEEARALRQVILAEDLAEIRKDVAITEKEAKEAEAKLQILMAGARKEEIEALQAELTSSETQRAFLQQQLEGTRVLSPATGIVATPSRLLKELNRQLVKKGDLIAKVYALNKVSAQILISEKEIAGIAVGQKVELRARAYPSETFEGIVTSIATSAQGTSGSEEAPATTSATSATGSKTIVVTTEIENQSLLLKPGMTGQAKIFCGRRSVRDLATRRAAQTLKVDFWSWW